MLNYKLKFEPGDLVWFVEDDTVCCDRVLNVTLVKEGYYYVLRSGKCKEESELFIFRSSAEEALEKKLKKKEHKYKPGDIVWYISFKAHLSLCNAYLIHKPYKGVVTEVKSSSCGPEYKVLGVSKDCICNMAEDRLFSTKEEAEQALDKKISCKCFEKDPTELSIPAPCAAEFEKINKKLDKVLERENS